MSNKVFYGGDTIKVTGKHLLNYGKVGTVSKWIHGDFYCVTLENDHMTVLKAEEMDHCILLSEGVGD